VEELAENLLQCATGRRFGLEADLEEQAKESGYYAFHVCVRQEFSVGALDYQGTQERTSRIEIQVTTELAEVISQLTHAYYEVRRESSPNGKTWQWDYVSDEFTSNFLGHELHALEARVMALRQKLRESSGPQKPRQSRLGAAKRSAKRGHVG
jgi:ppGpp synthetase/RelA/SpoT-type nucleotidyltranferase